MQKKFESLMTNHRRIAAAKGWPAPDYNLTWLKGFCFAHGWQEIYDNWRISGLKRDAPSIDRIKSDKPYSRTNIQLNTFGFNHDKARKEMTTKPVDQFDTDCNYITTFNSSEAAAQAIGGTAERIRRAARKGLARTAGFRWSYV